MLAGLNEPAGLVSGGEWGRINLALTLKRFGSLLLLDDPANDLDAETLASPEDALPDFPGCGVAGYAEPPVPFNLRGIAWDAPGRMAAPRLPGLIAMPGVNEGKS